MNTPTRLPEEFTETFYMFAFRHDIRKVFLEKRMYFAYTGRVAILSMFPFMSFVQSRA